MIRNPNKTHTPIVYTTDISNEIRKIFIEYIKEEKGTNRKRANYIMFCNACERENKDVSKTIESLTKL